MQKGPDCFDDFSYTLSSFRYSIFSSCRSSVIPFLQHSCIPLLCSSFHYHWVEDFPRWPMARNSLRIAHLLCVVRLPPIPVNCTSNAWGSRLTPSKKR